MQVEYETHLLALVELLHLQDAAKDNLINNNKQYAHFFHEFGYIIHLIMHNYPQAVLILVLSNLTPLNLS